MKFLVKFLGRLTLTASFSCRAQTEQAKCSKCEPVVVVDDEDTE